MVLAGVVLLIALLAFGLTTNAADTSIDDGIADGSPKAAPGFALALLDPGQTAGPIGKRLRAASADATVELSELRGVPTVLNFWASWCDPCREEAPVLERGWRSWGPRGVLFLGLNMQDATPDAHAFLDEFSISYPMIRDPDDSVANDYGLTGIPETYFIDGRGRAVGHTIGVIDDATLDRGASAARAGTVAGVSSGGDSRPPRGARG